MSGATEGARTRERLARTHRRVFECAAHYRESPLGTDARDAPRAPTLAALAEYIEATQPALGAQARQRTVSTDRKYRGRRFRLPGAGRTGTLLTVYDRATGENVFSHNSGERARTNSEAVEWLVGHRLARGVSVAISKTLGSDADSGRAATIEAIEAFGGVIVRFDDGRPSLEDGGSARRVSGHDLLTPLSAEQCRALAGQRPSLLGESEKEQSAKQQSAQGR